MLAWFIEAITYDTITGTHEFAQILLMTRYINALMNTVLKQIKMVRESIKNFQYNAEIGTPDGADPVLGPLLSGIIPLTLNYEPAKASLIINVIQSEPIHACTLNGTYPIDLIPTIVQG